MQHKVIFIMGVSGSGKTTIGQMLAVRMKLPFYDADDFHPVSNIEKMKAGVPLTDADRQPWLDQINRFVIEKLHATSILFACSALKTNYRKRLSANIGSCCRWVYLQGDFNTIQQRLQQRIDHYMPPALLQSQFEALELPENATVVDIHKTPDEITTFLETRLSDA